MCHAAMTPCLDDDRWKSVRMTTRVSKAVAIAGPLALATVTAAGIVLAASWLVAFPEWVVLSAWLIAIAAIIAVSIAAGIESRQLGHGPVRAVRRMVGDLGRFVLYFF